MSSSSLLNSQNIFIGVIFIILFAALYSYSFSKTHWYDGVDSQGSGTTKAGDDASGNRAPPSSSIIPSSAVSSSYNSQSIANPAELLPKDVNSKWSTLNPTVGSNNVAIPDLLDAGYHIGLDTIGNTRTNSCLDIRSCPLIPKTDVGPWNNSTIEPDIARVPFNIGVGLP